MSGKAGIKKSFWVQGFGLQTFARKSKTIANVRTIGFSFRKIPKVSTNIKLYKTFLVLIWFCGQAHKKRHKLSNRKFYVSSLLISNFSFLSICRTNANQTLSKCLHQTVEYIFRQDTNRQTRDLKPLLPHNY